MLLEPDIARGGPAPSSGAAPDREAPRAYSFGFLRLLLASLVIAGHTPELVDGHRHRELLTRIFGTISLGEFAVDSFFIISGFLISLSFIRSGSPLRYLARRVGRIYPGFAVSHLICVCLVAPLVGGALAGKLLFWPARETINILLLNAPSSLGAFHDTPHPFLNGSAWTIKYEFYCYLLVMALGGLGVLKNTRLLVGMALAALLAAAFMPVLLHGHIGEWQGALRLMGCFLAGAAFVGVHDKLSCSVPQALAAVAGLAIVLRAPHLAHLGVALFGTYLLFALAHALNKTRLASVNEGVDVSYGLYLYAWPIEKLLILFVGSASLFMLGLVSWITAMICGYVSWIFVEKPAQRWMKGQSRSNPKSRLGTLVAKLDWR